MPLPRLQQLAHLANRYGLVPSGGPRVGDFEKIDQCGGQHLDHAWVEAGAALVLRPAAHACLRKNLHVVNSGVVRGDTLISHQALMSAERGFSRGTFLQIGGRRPSRAVLHLDYDSLTPENRQIAEAHYPVLDEHQWWGRIVAIHQPLTRASPVAWVQRQLLQEVERFRDQPLHAKMWASTPRASV